ncbi:Hypothetical predicted protein [Pelobates cultripes]|uniref:Uncharacterized protein n=1 Tax=Pelobates cultripes TaxID=61616 RepID=A0AAD1SA47_PELCU|nr:Hypothetical predicted protein [Pelobates cultripes]
MLQRPAPVEHPHVETRNAAAQNERPLSAPHSSATQGVARSIWDDSAPTAKQDLKLLLVQAITELIKLTEGDLMAVQTRLTNMDNSMQLLHAQQQTVTHKLTVMEDLQRRTHIKTWGIPTLVMAEELPHYIRRLLATILPHPVAKKLAIASICRLPNSTHLKSPMLHVWPHKASRMSCRDNLENSAQIYVSVGKLKGIPNPVNSSDLQSTEAYPVITYNYYVTYEFIENQSSKELTAVASQPEEIYRENSSKSPVVVNSTFHTGSYKTGGAPWNEVIDCQYKKMHNVNDLLALKSFLISGMRVTVTEEKTLSWPLDPEQIQKSKVVSPSNKKGDRKEKGRSSSKGSKAESKSKKKKETFDDFRHDPPIMRTFGSVLVSLENLVQGELEVYSLCNFGILNSEEKRPSTACEKNIKKTKNQKPHDGRESAGSRKGTASSSGKGKRKHTAEQKPVEEQVTKHIEPLTAEIRVQLNTWKLPSKVKTP